MDPLLLTLIALSTTAAVVFGWLFVRLRHEERRRSDARVAALAEAIDTTGFVRPADRVDWMPENAPTLFAPERVERGRPGSIIRFGVAAAMGVALLIAIAMGNRGPSAANDERPAARAVARTAAPLELVSMRHERDGDTLKVLGLVRNPRTAGTLTRVSAVVLAFNRAGAFVASGRAGVDFTTLEPGDESPFVVTIPGAPDVGRYRVSFRTEAGVVQHVDRRAEGMRTAAVLE